MLFFLFRVTLHLGCQEEEDYPRVPSIEIRIPCFQENFP